MCELKEMYDSCAEKPKLKEDIVEHDNKDAADDKHDT